LSVDVAAEEQQELNTTAVILLHRHVQCCEALLGKNTEKRNHHKKTL
jgi:hypothetical protein